MPTERETKTIRYAELAASLCLLLVVIAWFLTSMDFASLVALVTALGAVIALFRRRIPGKDDILIIAVLVVVTGMGLYLIFGEDRCVDQKRAVIICNMTEQRAAQLLYEGDVELYNEGSPASEIEQSIEVVLWRSYEEGEKKRYILLTQRADSETNCPNCSTYVDGALFTEVDGNWYLDVRQKAIARLGFVDVQAQADLMEIGPSRFGYAYVYPGSTDGLDYENVLLITPTSERFDVILNELIGMNNFRDCSDENSDCWGYSATLTPLEGENQLFYDLLMLLDGTIQSEEGFVVPINKTIVYRFSHGENKYIELRQ